MRLEDIENAKAAGTLAESFAAVGYVASREINGDSPLNLGAVMGILRDDELIVRSGTTNQLDWNFILCPLAVDANGETVQCTVTITASQIEATLMEAGTKVHVITRLDKKGNKRSSICDEAVYKAAVKAYAALTTKPATKAEIQALIVIAAQAGDMTKLTELQAQLLTAV